MTVRDDLGRTVALPRPARRIVSLSPVATENLFAAGAGDTVVGVTVACTYPAAVRRLPKVGGFTTPSYEQIFSLKPELILVESATLTPAALEKLAARVRCPVFAQLSRRYADVGAHLRQIGVLTGRERAAEPVARATDAAAIRVARPLAGKSPVSVFIEVSDVPLYGAGPGTFIDDVLKIAGGKNVLTGPDAFPVVSKEALLAADPECYVVATGPDGVVKRTFAPPLDRLRAVKGGRVVGIPADLLFRATPRLADGLRRLARALHP